MKNLFILIGLCYTLSLSAQSPDNAIKNLLIIGKYKEAATYVDSLLRKGAKSPMLFFYAGKANEGLMKYNEAYRHYKTWLASDTNNRDAKLAVARLSNLAGHLNEALNYYEQLSSEDSLHFITNYSLGRLYQQTNQYEKAILTYNRLLSADSLNITLLTALGDCCQSLDLAPEALSFYTKAYQQDKSNGRVVIKAAMILRKEKKHRQDFLDSIIALADTAIRYNPNNIQLEQNRGILKYMNKRYSECDTIFAKLVKLEEKPSLLTSKYYALTLYQIDNYPLAEKWLARSDSILTDENGNHLDIDLALKYGETLKSTRQPDRAIQIFDEVELQLQPDSVVLSRVKFLYGITYFSTKEDKKALLAYWEAYKLNPMNKQAIANLTYICQPKDTDESLLMSQGKLKEIRLFTCILFLEKFVEENKYTATMKKYCREVLTNVLKDMFIGTDKKITLRDPDGKEHTYTYEKIYSLVNPSETTK